jgi:murein DD-endopeptidase MepM/ murein hydrolase activator NlpD
VTAVAASPVAPKPAETDSQKAAKQLEAFFLRRLLAEARPQGGGMLDGGFAGDTFKQMLDEAIADKMAGAGGLGMANMFANQLGGKGEAAINAASRAPASMPAMELPRAMPMPSTKVELEPGQLAMPVHAHRVASNYGMRTDPIHGQKSMHPGIDMAAPTGTPVSAAAAGVVTHAGPAGTYGNLVTIRHANGLETRYAHLDSVGVKKGAQIEAGVEIGKVGSTGRSTGPHLHFEVREDGKLKDPAGYLPLNRSGNQSSR